MIGEILRTAAGSHRYRRHYEASLNEGTLLPPHWWQDPDKYDDVVKATAELLEACRPVGAPCRVQPFPELGFEAGHVMAFGVLCDVAGDKREPLYNPERGDRMRDALGEELVERVSEFVGKTDVRGIK